MVRAGTAEQWDTFSQTLATTGFCLFHRKWDSGGTLPCGPKCSTGVPIGMEHPKPWPPLGLPGSVPLFRCSAGSRGQIAHFADGEHPFRSNVNGRRGGIARGANCSLGVHDRVGSARRKSYPRPPARLRSPYSRLAGGRRWVTRVQPTASVVLFLRNDSPLRSTLCA